MQFICPSLQKQELLICWLQKRLGDSSLQDYVYQRRDIKDVPMDVHKDVPTFSLDHDIRVLATCVGTRLDHARRPVVIDLFTLSYNTFTGTVLRVTRNIISTTYSTTFVAILTRSTSMLTRATTTSTSLLMWLMLLLLTLIVWLLTTLAVGRIVTRPTRGSEVTIFIAPMVVGPQVLFILYLVFSFYLVFRFYMIFNFYLWRGVWSWTILRLHPSARMLDLKK